MAWFLRKSIPLLPGVRLNLSKTGPRISLGVPGARVSLGSRGPLRLYAGRGMLRFQKSLAAPSPAAARALRNASRRLLRWLSTRPD